MTTTVAVGANVPGSLKVDAGDLRTGHEARLVHDDGTVTIALDSQHPHAG